MALFAVTFTRRVVSYDEVTRYIEAPDAEAAQARADEEADAFDNDCPDDATETGHGNCESWGVDSLEPVDAVPHGETADILTIEE